VQTHSLKALALLLCLALSLAGAVSLYAGGRPESQLADAERLIQQQDYAGALKLLAAIQRDNPDLRDATSRLIAQIMTVTQHYNSVLEELNHASAAGDVAAMQKVLPELQKIDPQRAAGLSKTAGVLVGVLQLMNTAESLLARERRRRPSRCTFFRWLIRRRRDSPFRCRSSRQPAMARSSPRT